MPFYRNMDFFAQLLITMELELLPTSVENEPSYLPLVKNLMTANMHNNESRESEFVQLLTAHQSDIYLYLRSLTLNPDIASEVLQDANLVLWEKRGQFAVGTNFRAWAFQIARYKLLQHQANRKRGGVCFSDALVDELSLQIAADDSDAAELLDDLRRCMAELQPQDRELIGRRYSKHATCERIAATIGRPVRWVYKALSRIRKSLSDCIAQRVDSRRDK